MLEWFIERHVISVFIILLGVISLMTLSVLNTVYTKLLKESKNMSLTNSSLLKNIKLKYENCYKLELYTNEVQAFIDKSLYEKRIFKIPIYRLESISIEAIYMCVVIGFLGTFLNITYYMQQDILNITMIFLPGIMGFMIGSILLSTKAFLAIEMKKHIFYSNVKDYLENTLKNKLDQQIKKEVIYENYNKMEEMAQKNIENEKNLYDNKENISYLHENVESIQYDNGKGKKQKQSAINDKENIINQVINEIIK
ncbi:hypothetical protein EDC19_2807 [Natranaerovirga hydrolytica]|uniref:MotA/TolQ/ExbB proton channel family protein n=1 Tax=Natranaerovirga hydrolytica TaxID=680378 RepID=A0A4R1MAG3_9FIRM|nr:hypothetical protein [Natranaerovirga hydrolytica]TCK86753.1 hypothetical protein EDC19_2807 [Natranaerovirga hydrolytica]